METNNFLDKNVSDFSIDDLMEAIKKDISLENNPDMLPLSVRLQVAEKILYFFKSRNISQIDAVTNGLLLYINLILWNENKKSPITNLEEFQFKYYREHKI